VGEGGTLVRQYFDYAERGAVVLEENLSVPGVQVYESPFEEEVARQLMARGWNVKTQVGVSRYRIDIGVLHPDEPGRFIAGIECDGATYHSAETARDRDITRQQVLERLGWRILRVWSPDWFRERDAVLADLDTQLRQLV
jgi:very-short-patch-repair endonuclease